jgi:hypothetical protein
MFTSLTPPRHLSSTCATSSSVSEVLRTPTHGATHQPRLPLSFHHHLGDACETTMTMKMTTTKTKRWKTPCHPPTSNSLLLSRDTSLRTHRLLSTHPTGASTATPPPHPQLSCPATTATANTRRTPPPRFTRRTHTTMPLPHRPFAPLRSTRHPVLVLRHQLHRTSAIPSTLVLPAPAL